MQSKPSAWTISEETFLCHIQIAIPKRSTDAAIVFPAWSSSLWAAAHQWDSLVQMWPLLSSCGGPSPWHSSWHSPLADFYHADLCTCSHGGLSSGSCRAPFAPCMVCGHTVIFKNGLCLLWSSLLQWEVPDSSMSLGETGFGAVVGMPSVIWWSILGVSQEWCLGVLP